MTMLVMTKANPAIHWGCWVMPLMLSTARLRRIERTTLYQLQISQLQILQHRSSMLLAELDKSTSLVPVDTLMALMCVNRFHTAYVLPVRFLSRELEHLYRAPCSLAIAID